MNISTMNLKRSAVHLVYATPYNFMGRKLYHSLTHAFMLPELAECTGHFVPMGSEYDYFGDEARITAEEELRRI